MLQEKYFESLKQARKAMQIADHMTYITFPLVKEKRLLLKVLSELGSSVLSTINAILQYEYTWKRIQLYSDARANFDTFKRVSARYKINAEQLMKLTEIIRLAERHKKSPFEFIKNDKIVIMSDGMQTDTITLEKIKGFILESKDFLRKASLEIKK
ncbi:MAG: hypothetical protein KKA64_01120 [Nanoarchaeota archaeon]|nr:hypothetical protein [Nanoarchaeota archaeon]